MTPIWTQVKMLQSVSPDTEPDVTLTSDWFEFVPLSSVMNCSMHASTAELCLTAETMIQTRARIKARARAAVLTATLRKAGAAETRTSVVL